MAAQDITQERLILGNFVQLLLFRVPQFALFLLPSHATSLLLFCLVVSAHSPFFFHLKILFFYFKGRLMEYKSLFPSHPARSLHLLVTTWAVTHQLFGTDPLPSRAK